MNEDMEKRLIKLAEERSENGAAKATKCKCSASCNQLVYFNGQDIAYYLPEQTKLTDSFLQIKVNAGPGYLSPSCAVKFGLVSREEVMRFLAL